MNLRTAGLVVGLIALMSLLSFAATSYSAPADGAREWEHLAMPVDAANAPGDAETSRQIIKLGKEGWELVDVESISKDGTSMKLIYFFKRPK